MAEIDDLAAAIAVNQETLNKLVANEASVELADLKAKIAAATVEIKRQDDAAVPPAPAPII